MSICTVCEREFKQYQGRNRTKCPTCYAKIKRHINLLAAVTLLGGKCVRCGYDEDPIALAFHHIDPSTKKYKISDLWTMKWETIREEVLKCELQCSNCHTIEHSNRNKTLLEEVDKRIFGA